MTRKYNFSAGPAVLPEEVLTQAKEEMLDWNGSGMSVMEMSHREEHFMAIASKAEANLREILSIPSNYKVLFLQGGATAQFAAIPMNLALNKRVDYVNTGAWSEKAISEAKRYSDVNVVASGEGSNFMAVPAIDSWNLSDSAVYLHYTPNETIAGVEFHFIPEVKATLVADMSSTILSRPLDVSRFGIIYAGAQKNIGPSGLTIVIIREDLLQTPDSKTPACLNYKLQSDNESMYNTPPCYAWYTAGLVFEWIKAKGGLEAMAKINKRKADKLYAFIDSSNFYNSPVNLACRSWMNIPFTLKSADLDKPFLAGAKAAGLTSLKGHRSVGGMRASIYNAMPEAGVDALLNYMADFAKKNA